MNADSLNQTITQFRKTYGTPPDLFKFESGNCGEFAFALCAWLAIHNVPARVITILRAESQNPGMTWDEICFSHQIVEALDTTWDYLGENAATRWEDRWRHDDTFFNEFIHKETLTAQDHRQYYHVKPFDQQLSNKILATLLSMQ